MYTEIKREKEKMENVKPSDYFDVYGPEMTDWTSAYSSNTTGATANDLDMDCIRRSIDTDYVTDASDDGTEKFIPQKTQLWYDEPSELFRSDKLLHIFPRPQNTFEENLNTIARLGIYISIGMAYAYNNIKYLLLILVVLLFTMFLYVNNIQSIKEFMELCTPRVKPHIKETRRKKKKEKSIKNEKFFEIDNLEGNKSEQTVYNKPDKLKPPTYRNVQTMRGDFHFKPNQDMICANKSENETTGGYDWLKQSSHAEFRSNNRLINTTPRMQQQIMSDVSDGYGKLLADRNSYVPNHPRDFINTNFDEFLYGKNLDRRLYYGRR